MKATKIKELTNEEIEKQIADNRAEIFSLRMKFQSNQLDNPAKIKLLRKDIARLETEKSARRNAAK